MENCGFENVRLKLISSDEILFLVWEVDGTVLVSVCCRC